MNKCGDCVFLEKDDGAPYCVTLPLYTERDPDDEACEYFTEDRPIATKAGLHKIRELLGE